jgi:predicted MFS family arabinose efflux permease
MVASYTLITLTDNRAILLILVVFTGISGAYFPILYTEAFKLKGVTINRIPIAVATVMAAFGLGLVIGPLITGFLEQITGLQLAMIVAAQFGVLLLPAGILIKFTNDPQELEN